MFCDFVVHPLYLLSDVVERDIITYVSADCFSLSVAVARSTTSGLTQPLNHHPTYTPGWPLQWRVAHRLELWTHAGGTICTVCRHAQSRCYEAVPRSLGVSANGRGRLMALIAIPVYCSI